MITDGQTANQTSFNNAFMSRTVDTSTVGQVDLNKPSGSGDTISDSQAHHNAHLQDRKLIFFVNNGGKIAWTGSQITFTDNLLVISKEWGVTNTILTGQSPISLNDGDSAWISLSRYGSASCTVSTGSLPKGKDVFRIATRIGTNLVLWDNTMMRSGASAGIGEPVVNDIQESFSGDGSTVTFVLANLPRSNNSVLVFKNGLFQRQGTAYTIVGKSITFTTAPDGSPAADIDVKYSI